MIIKFKSDKAGEFIMMGHVALPLLRMMGGSGNTEGAVSGELLDEALQIDHDGDLVRRAEGVTRRCAAHGWRLRKMQGATIVRMAVPDGTLAIIRT